MAHLQKLASEKTHGEVILEEKVDKGLIGGYIIELVWLLLWEILRLKNGLDR